MSILVEGLSKLYGTQKAVDGISFTAGPGVLGFWGQMVRVNQPL
jgi:ABC-2 type transport system ATP-binding protein